MMPYAAASTASDPQIVLILVGLIGSGKSTFAEALQGYLPTFRRCNQDELGDRRAVEAAARSALEMGLSVTVDRTNFDASQRATWVRIAREFPGTLLWVLVFDTPYEICAERLRWRTSHPTITSPEQGLDVLQRFVSQYRSPQAHEGFDQMLFLPVTDQPTDGVYSRTDVENIITRLQQSPKIAPSEWRPYTAAGGQSRGRGGYQRGYYAPSGYTSRGRGGRGASQQSWRSGQ
ncbi:hypothetical protein PHLGIDRAFT_103760 [Phlebiopsis gigantea 11061_1 CR5-6]|uniref:P-loop containing nucleoside triphosphate hydrolase protein n=1 Tax=Phlebiopsis gigantea (strain 11061_1 CR5-6) TaxID=745531 RepID=A0A0C3PPD3_PHLG1|nr:hypothetical protein PHLGIDRAFT_103760 [Phlebiopsis gigantea 11061_1 CR5-6]